MESSRRTFKTLKDEDFLYELLYWPELLIIKQPFRTIFYLYCVIGYLCFLGASFLLMMNLNVNYWLQYCPIVVGCSYAFFIYVLILFKHNDYFDMINETIPKLSLWSKTKPRVFKELLKEAKYVRGYAISHLILIIIGSAVNLPWHGDEYEEFIALKLYFDLFSDYKSFCQIVLSSQIFHIGLITLGSFFLYLYCMLHLWFQLIILNHRLDIIARSNKHSNFDLIDDSAYQKYIKNQLKQVIRHHQRIQQFRRRINNLIYYPILAILFVGMLVCVAAIMYLFKINIVHMIRGTLTLGITIFGLIVYTGMGQFIENESGKLYYSIQSLPWYNWSISNRKILAYMLCRSYEPLRFGCSGVVTLNFRLLLSIYRGATMVLTLALNFYFYKSDQEDS